MAHLPEPEPEFTAQEEAFLRAYSESCNRLQALMQCGMITTPPALDQQQALMQEASRIIAKAERMPLSAIASAIGADRLFLLAMLKKVCEAPEGHIAIKGLQLLARLHGLWNEPKGARQHVALVFAEARQPTGATKPSDLPFTLASGEYRVVENVQDGEGETR